MPPFILPYIDVIFITGGLFALFAGGSTLVRGAVAISQTLRLPRLLTGIVVVGLATSLPELMISLTALRAGAPDLAVGNIIGSNIANFGLILGLALLIAPIRVIPAGVRRDVLALLAATMLMAIVASNGTISPRTGWGMVCALGVFVVAVLIFQKGPVVEDPAPIQTSESTSWPLALLFVVGGTILLICGSELLIHGITDTARALGISDAIMGLTFLALGAALPELTVAIISAFKRESDLILGNVIGSNLFNILGILGLTAALYPVSISPVFLRNDIPVMAGLALFVAVLVFMRNRIGRVSGFMLLLAYVTYIGWLMVGAEGLTALIPAMG